LTPFEDPGNSKKETALSPSEHVIFSIGNLKGAKSIDVLQSQSAEERGTWIYVAGTHSAGGEYCQGTLCTMKAELYDSLKCPFNRSTWESFLSVPILALQLS
jgi:hypothetical protein